MGNLKSSYVKEVLIKEYEDDIGLHERPEKNKSKFVYDKNVEATKLKQQLIPLALQMNN